MSWQNFSFSVHCGGAMSFPLGRGLSAIAGLAAIALISACSSGDAAPSPTVSAAPTTSAAPPSGPTTAEVDALSKSDTEHITHAFVTFFDGATTPTTAATVLQHGPNFAAALTAQAGSQQAKTLSAKVVAISRDPEHPSPHVAKVTFSLLSGGQILLPDSPGLAVEVGGRWLVSAQTFCALLQLQGSPPPQCSNSSITALPAG
jgi:hypothetical protein